MARNQSWVPRPKGDFYPTQRMASVPLVRDILPAYISRGDLIWECACGDGALSKVLRGAGHHVVSTDLYDRGFGTSGVDFLKTRKLRRDADVIITNPPTADGIHTDFVEHALSLDPLVAIFFLPTKFLETPGRYNRLFSKHPPFRVFQFIERIKIFSGEYPIEDQPGWSSEAFSWWVWRRGYDGITGVVWIHRWDGD